MKLVLPTAIHQHKAPVRRADPARGIVYKHKRPGVVAAGRKAALVAGFQLLAYFCSCGCVGVVDHFAVKNAWLNKAINFCRITNSAILCGNAISAQRGFFCKIIIYLLH
jgi:hypothetical protein